MNNKSKFFPKPSFNNDFNIRYPDIMIRHDDKSADMFFSYVISGDVNNLNNFIIQNSIPINIRKNDGQNALHLSVTSGLPTVTKINMIKYLLMNYIPVNEKDNNGNTSLLLATKRMDKEIVELLMEYGADPSIGNTFKIKPLHYVSSGILHNCEDVILDSIIQKPTSQTYDKMEINELTKSVTKFYNDTLVNFGNLTNTELSDTAEKNYDKRILAFLQHNKYMAENLKDEEIKQKITDLKNSTLKKYTDKIKDKLTNQNEVKKYLIDIRKEYVNDYVSIIEKVDRLMLKPIDLQPVDHIDNDGFVIANKDGGVLNLWKVHGAPTLNQTLQKSYMQIFQDIPQHLDVIKKNTDIYIDNIIINDKKSPIDSLKNQIIHSGKQIQKLQLLDNIMRLKKMGSNLQYHDFQKIDTKPKGGNNILLNEALKGLFQTDTRNNFGITALDQTSNKQKNGMNNYHVISAGTGIAINGRDLLVPLSKFTPNANTNQYYTNLLDNIKYDDDSVFSNPIEINFSTPVTIQLNNNTIFTDFFQKGTSVKNAKWTFKPSNSVNNVVKIKLEYNSLTQVKLTATYNIQINRTLVGPPVTNQGAILQETISTEYYSNLKITYIGNSGAANNTPWDPAVIGINHNLLQAALDTDALPHNNLYCITLSLPNTGGRQVYATQHLYLPLYAFHEAILHDYKSVIENHIVQITNDVNNCKKTTTGEISLDGYKGIFSKLKTLIKNIYGYQVRYKIMLQKYGDDQIFTRLQKLEDIKKELSNYQNIDKVLYEEMLEGIDLLNWKYKGVVNDIEENLQNIIQNINDLIENVNDISLINTINHYWNIQETEFDINRIISHNIPQTDPPSMPLNAFGVFYKIELLDLDDIDYANYNKSSDIDNYLISKHYDDLNNNTPIVNELKLPFINGISFGTNTSVNPHEFVKPTYNIVGSSLIPNYFSLVRYRMLEEILLYIFYKKATGEEKKIYDKIDDYVTNNIGKMVEEYRIPMVLSILGDTIDNLLINNLKKELYDVANNEFLEFMDTNLNGITLGTAKDGAKGISYIELDFKTINFDDAFELNLGDIDSNVIDAIKKKVTGLKYDQIQILNKGDELIMEPEYKNIDHNARNKNAIGQQIFYSTGFLDNSSKNLCIKYNHTIMNKIIENGVDLDDTDLYGNTPLFYAIKTNNYLAVKNLLDNNARALYKNDQDMTPLHYTLNKLKDICNYFGPGPNLILLINNSYNTGIKDELLKIDISRNLMKNYDKIVELYLFMYNSNAFSNIYAKNYNILKKFIDMISDQLKGTYQEKDANNKYLAFTNPLINYLNDSNNSIFVKKNVSNILLNNITFLNNQQKNLLEDQAKLTAQKTKLSEYTSLLDDGNGTSYKQNIDDQIKTINDKFNENRTKITDNRNLIKKIENEIATTAKDDKVKSRDVDTSKSINDLINQNILVSQLFDDNEVSHNDSKPYLNTVHNMLRSDTHGMSTYNVHSHINLQIKDKIKELLEYLGSSYYDESKFKDHKDKFTDLKDIFFNILSSRIFMKNSKSKQIKNNSELNEDYKMICFTIDQVVGYSFYKVLTRIVMTYLSKIIPPGKEDESKYMQYIGEKTNIILNHSAGEKLSVKNIVLPSYDYLNNKDKFKYEPSYLTKRIVTTIGNFKTDEEYSEQDNSATFQLIINLILNNNVIPIDDKSKLSLYLTDTIIPYFESYYTISVKTLSNLTQNYENMIQNQYVLLKIILELLEKITDTKSLDYQIQNV